MRKAMLMVVAILVGSPIPSSAASDCSDAVDSYNSAIGEISYNLKRYSRCVAASDGSDDCSSQFRRLKYAQDEFESAVSEYQSYCE